MSEMEKEIKEERPERYSYSRLGVYEGCKYKYKLTYVDGNYINTDSVATEFGTLLHYIEEQMAKRLMETSTLTVDDYQDLINMFNTIELREPKETVLGLDILREKYKDEWLVPDKLGRNYEDKANDYINKGIYRLRNFLISHPQYIVLDAEKEFEVEVYGYTFHGYIDRVYKNEVTGELLIEDIKTWKEKAAKKDLKAPLQLALYALAASEIYNTPKELISAAYELPLCDIKQPVTNLNFIEEALAELRQILDGIEAKDFAPNPSVLCHWCVFCKTYPNQPEEAKGLCPYFCRWTRENKNFSVEYEWLGAENHDKILEAFQRKLKGLSESKFQERLESMVSITSKQADAGKDGARFVLMFRD